EEHLNSGRDCSLPEGRTGLVSSSYVGRSEIFTREREVALLAETHCRRLVRRVIGSARVVAAVDEEDGANLCDAGRSGLVTLSAAVHGHVVLVVAGRAGHKVLGEVGASANDNQ